MTSKIHHYEKKATYRILYGLRFLYIKTEGVGGVEIRRYSCNLGNTYKKLEKAGGRNREIRDVRCEGFCYFH